MNTDRYKAKALTVGDNPEWVEGFCSQFKDGSVYVFPPDGLHSFDNYEIDPATLCQCTGQKDSQGKLIFEGDILDHAGLGFWRIEWNRSEWVLRLHDDRVVVATNLQDIDHMTLTGKNIHDPKQTEE